MAQSIQPLVRLSVICVCTRCKAAWGLPMDAEARAMRVLCPECEEPFNLIIGGGQMARNVAVAVEPAPGTEGAGGERAV